MARKAARLARLHDATDRQLGERVLIKPQKGGGYVVGGADPDRPETELTGYVARATSVVNASGTTAGDTNARLRYSADTCKILTSALPYTVVEGDLLQLLDQPETPTVRVSRTAPYGTDRTILFLVNTSR